MLDKYTNRITDFVPDRKPPKKSAFPPVDISTRVFNDDLEYEDFDDVYDNDTFPSYPSSNY